MRNPITGVLQIRYKSASLANKARGQALARSYERACEFRRHKLSLLDLVAYRKVMKEIYFWRNLFQLVGALPAAPVVLFTLDRVP